jgi:hypothetical protein
MSAGAIAVVLVVGLLGGIATTVLAFRARARTREILCAVLVGAAAFYVFFALRAGEGAFWLLLELAGVAVYGGMGALGLRASPWWLVAGWALHVAWDLGLHFFGPGARFAPPAYPVACLSWDLWVAGYLAYRITRGRAPAARPRLAPS